MRSAFLLMALASLALAQEVQVEVLPYADDKTPRRAYLRSETPTVRIRLTNKGAEQLKAEGRLILSQGDTPLVEREFAADLPPNAPTDAKVQFALADLKAAEYLLTARCTVADKEFVGTSPFCVCAAPDTEGLALGIWWESAYKRKGHDELLVKLGEIGMTHVQTMVPYPELLDACLRHRMQVLHIQHGNARAGGFKGDQKDLIRLNASGKPYLNNGKWKKPIAGITDLDWQRATAKNLGEHVAPLMAWPAYDPRICTSDDYWRRTGLDYNAANVRRFREAYGIDPPRPPEALESDYPLSVARPKGVIPDDDPWVLWLRFNARDVLGRFNRQVADAVLEATGGRGRIGPVSGGGEGAWGFVPYADMISGQWPPYNFGESGFNMLCCYNYNLGRMPALAQVWWYEMARMGNRDLPQFLMPETMGKRRAMHLHNAYLYMASGLDGLAYFIYEWSSQAALEALKEVGPLMRRQRKLLGALEPAPRTVGLLIPFENACFRSLYPADALYAFCNLAMAHAEVEPVWPEELPARAAQYKVILLHDVDWLTESNLKRLRYYMAQGGTVLCDSLTEVDVPGAVKLDFPLAAADRKTGYGDLEQIARVRQAVEPHVQPWATSDDPHLLLRRFTSGGVDYLWAVNLMSHKEDLDHLPEPGKERDAGPVPAYADFDRREHAATIRVRTGERAVYDVLTGKKVESEAVGDELIIQARMRGWQGCLLALYPAAPDAIRVKAPERATRGKGAEVSLEVLAGDRILRANFPIEITVVEPDGNENPEYGRSALARGGVHRFAIPFARNDAPGKWTVTARELSTGRTESATIELPEE